MVFIVDCWCVHNMKSRCLTLLEIIGTNCRVSRWLVEMEFFILITIFIHKIIKLTMQCIFYNLYKVATKKMLWSLCMSLSCWLCPAWRHHRWSRVKLRKDPSREWSLEGMGRRYGKVWRNPFEIWIYKNQGIYKSQHQSLRVPRTPLNSIVVYVSK